MISYGLLGFRVVVDVMIDIYVAAWRYLWLVSYLEVLEVAVISGAALKLDLSLIVYRC